MSVPFIEENDQTRARHEHLDALRRLVGNVYPNKFERSRVIDAQREDTITGIKQKYSDDDVKAWERIQPTNPNVRLGPPPEKIEMKNQLLNSVKVRIAGRIASPPRVKGKAAFVHLSDGVTRLQVYIRREEVKVVNNTSGKPIDEEDKGWDILRLLDHGDFIGVGGYLFITRTGELTIHVEHLQFLAKALLPMPHKIHGITDVETRRRQRYVDLIAGSLKIELRKEKEEEEVDNSSLTAVPLEEQLTPRQVFERRSKIISEMRRFLEDHSYLEVETPMLTPLATGAAAKPFKTHHNALDIDLYARIAPELYLKRLLVGGFEKIYELNRNFRNEGISSRHNPEFTMLEFYWAYADVNQMMDFCEELLRSVVSKVIPNRLVWTTQLEPGEETMLSRVLAIDFSLPFQRLSMKEAIARFWPRSLSQLGAVDFSKSWLDDPNRVRQLEIFLRYHDPEAVPYYDILPRASQFDDMVQGTWRWATGADKSGVDQGPDLTEGSALAVLFETVAEPHLVQPTFITDFPKSISPLSKASPANPSVAERFELFIDGMECANGFSELNDPAEQYQRFMDQMTQRERGDEEAMVMDEDYIRALSYGMPPAAGIGIGIDRFVMLLTNKQSIRDVILFPHMRPERKAEEQDPAADQDIPPTGDS